MTAIMLVENNGYYRKRIKKMLEIDLQLEVYTDAKDAPTALRLFREKRPDISIINLMLPGISGLDLVKTIQKNEPDTILILMSNLYNRYTMEQAMRSGARDIIIKPFSDEEFLAMIKHHMEYAYENN